MNTLITATGAGNITAAQLFSDCMNHLQFACMKTKDEALAIMSEGGAGVVFQAEISKAKNITAAQIVRYNYSPRVVREGTVIEENEARARVHWTREWFAHRGDQAFPLNVRTWVAKSRLTFVSGRAA